MEKLNCGPEEYDRLPWYWKERALVAMDAEGYAQSEKMKQH